MSRILIIAFEFPPLNSGGSRRPDRIAKSLAERGHEVCVWTADYEGTWLHARCDKVEEKNTPRLTVEHLPLRDKNQRFKWYSSGYSFQPDGYYTLWSKALITRWNEMLASDLHPDVIFLTIPPFSMYRFAQRIRRESTIPLVVDFRDHWSLWVMTPFASRLHYQLMKLRERKLIEAASAVLTVTTEMKADLIQSHGKKFGDRIHCVTNSFDDYRSAQWNPSFQSNGKIVIGYFGAFYYFPEIAESISQPWYRRKPWQWFLYAPRDENWKYRSPFFFFKLIRKLVDRHPEYAHRLELVFVGSRPAWWDEMVVKSGVKNLIRHTGPLSAKASLQMQQTCDLLLLTSVKVNQGRDYCIAGKTFEFFAARIPILGVVTVGAQRDILERSGAALCIDPDQPEVAAEELHELLSGQRTLHPNTEFMERFQTSRVIYQLEEILLGALRKGPFGDPL